MTPFLSVTGQKLSEIEKEKRSGCNREKVKSMATEKLHWVEGRVGKKRTQCCPLESRSWVKQVFSGGMMGSTSVCLSVFRGFQAR